MKPKLIEFWVDETKGWATLLTEEEGKRRGLKAVEKIEDKAMKPVANKAIKKPAAKKAVKKSE